MFVVWFISGILWLAFDASAITWSVPVTSQLQLLCIENFSSGAVRELGAAVVCGEDLPAGALRDSFLKLGLYHVLVVSGAHLILLSEVLSKVRAPRNIRISLLLCFTLMTGAQAPLVRAACHMLLRSRGLLHEQHERQHLFLSMIAAYCLHPPWLYSLSLALSFLASLGLYIGRTPLQKFALLSALVLPLILPLGSVNALGLLTGFLLSPVIEIFLFPACLMAWLFTALQSPLEPTLNVLSNTLNALAARAPDSFLTAALVPAIWIPAYVAVCFIAVPKIFPRPELS